MKEILKQFGSFCLEALKQLDWKNVVYKALKGTVLPMLEQKAKDSASKVDDVMVAGFARLVEKFLAPEPTTPPVLPPPAPVKPKAA